MIIHWMLFDVRCSIHYVQIKMSSFNRKKKFSFKWNVKTSYVCMMEKRIMLISIYFIPTINFLFIIVETELSHSLVFVWMGKFVLFSLSHSFHLVCMFGVCVCVYAPFTFFYYSPNLFYLSQNVLWMSCLSHSTVWLWQKYRWFKTGE